VPLLFKLCRTELAERLVLALSIENQLEGEIQ
jgi:hypothetical protein